MPKYQLAHKLSPAQRAERERAIRDHRHNFPYDEGFAASTGLRGVAPNADVADPGIAYLLAQAFHQGRVGNNRERSQAARVSELHRDSDPRALAAEDILIRSVTTRAEHEDALYALPPSEVSKENILCLLTATRDSPCLIEAGEDLAPLSVHDYDKLFHHSSDYLPPPKHAGRLLFDDAAFARSAVEGPNPLLIESVTPERLSSFASEGFGVLSIPSSTLFQGDSPFAGEYLADLAVQGRLYYEEYPRLEGVRGQGGIEGDWLGTGKEPRFTFAPKVLYGLADIDGKPTLMPIAIQPRKTHARGADDGPIFYPHTPGAVTYEADLAANSADYTWQIAKTLVLSANTLHHEAVSHLGRTHLLMEAFALAGGRQLSVNHPVRGIVAPHMFGTFFINNTARATLIAGGGDVDKYLAPELEDFVRVSRESIAKLAMDELFLPEALKRRGVHPTESARPLPSYRYAEDALLLWDAIGDYVRDFLGGYYKTQADLDQDLNSELGAFLSELRNGSTDGGHALVGIDLDPVETREDLYRLVTMLIFTCSCQHAAVNSAQADILGNPAWCPTAVYRDAPSGFGATRQDYLETLPPFEKAVGQVFVGYQLGGLVYKPLTDLSALQYAKMSHSDYSHILRALRQFRSRLRHIGRAIRDRNAGLPAHARYQYLDPARISQSINV